MKTMNKPMFLRGALLTLGLCLSLALVPRTVRAQAACTMADAPVDVTRWIETRFGQGKTPPFSFVYDGRPSQELLKKWKYSARRIASADEGAVEYLYTYSQKPAGLTVECRVK